MNRAVPASPRWEDQLRGSARRFLAAACCLACWSGCSAAPLGPAHASTPGNTALAPPLSAASPPTSAPGAAPEPPRSESDERARKLVDSVLQRVSLLRELPALGPVQARVIDRATMLAQVRATVRTQIPPEAIRGESDFLKAFGFLPESFDYEAGVYRLIRSQLAGYYDPDVRVMFLMDDLAKDDQETTLAHELVHALQDQHYRLGPKLAFEPDGNDRQAAMQCVAEGDATSAMLDYLLAPGQRVVDIPEDQLRAQMVATTASSPDLASFPHVLRASLVAPYIDGVLFVQRLRWRGGWKAVDAIWAALPTTSEQVLHLDKLDAREPAELVPVPSHAALGGQWEAVHTDVYGEQGLRISLEDWMSPSAAAAAAKGWGGDHAVVLHRQGGVDTQSAAAWHIRFDAGPTAALTDAEAVEAFGDIATSWGFSPTRAAVCRTVQSGRHMAMIRQGRDLALVAGPPHPAGSAAGAQASCAQELQWAAEVVAQR